ncbi:MAG: DUF4191 domain-containing protein [Geodermatophilaceae bacterium]|nr:DUF4191 domain-containing protein [Geodermatophilaceae bacterium]
MAKTISTDSSTRRSGSTPPRPGKVAPLTGRAAKREARKAKKAAKGQGKIKTIIQGYKMTKERDRKLPWVMLLAFVLTVTVVLVPSILFLNVWVMLPFAIMLGVLVALILFGRRAQKAAFGQVEGQPGAAAWVLEGMRGQWEVEAGVAGTTSMDAVHRVLGRPGFLLVGEGVPHRVKSLLAQEKKKLARVAGEVPIYDIVVGDSEGQVPLNKLSTHVMKLPRNITAAEVNTMKRKLSALGGGGSSKNRMPIPQGPLPKGAAMTVSQRAIRRRGG